MNTYMHTHTYHAQTHTHTHTAKSHVLYLSDVYAAVQGVRPQSAYTPLTPHSPSSPSPPLAPSSTPTPSSAPPSSSSSSSSSSSRPHHQAAINPKKLRRSSSTSLTSGTGSADCYFTLYALRSQPGSIGKLARVTFRCPTPETAETWVEQITYQMQSESLPLPPCVVDRQSPVAPFIVNLVTILLL